VRALEIVHESGNTHNDLKLDNIMITDSKDQNIVLIDYGFVTQYTDDAGNHFDK
jgi:serine/threonine protein kinase